MERSKRNRERVEYQILKEWETETLFGMVNDIKFYEGSVNKLYGFFRREMD